jgi:hypothetical protein
MALRLHWRLRPLPPQIFSSAKDHPPADEAEQNQCGDMVDCCDFVSNQVSKRISDSGHERLKHPKRNRDRKRLPQLKPRHRQSIAE